MADKSGIADNIINLPQGGGAQKGMGETFSPHLFSGTGNFSFPIGVPAGRNGLQPSLTAGYSSGNGNSEYGLGWGLSVPGVMRKSNKGIPLYDDENDTFILSGAEDLIAVDYSKELIDGVWHFKTQYQPRTEGLFARILHHKTNAGTNYWEVRSKDGLTSYYGNPQATDPDETENTVIADPKRRDHIFGWKLYKTVDLFGNDIVYQYERDLQESEYHHFDQLYLSRIDYTNYNDGSQDRYLCSVHFSYEDRPDPFSSHSAGFEIRTTKRVLHVDTYTHPHVDDKPAGYDYPDTSRYVNMGVEQYPIDRVTDYNSKEYTRKRYDAGTDKIVALYYGNDGAGNLVTDANGAPQEYQEGAYNLYRDYQGSTPLYLHILRVEGTFERSTLQLNFELLAGDIDYLELWDDSIPIKFIELLDAAYPESISYTTHMSNIAEFYLAISGKDATHGDSYPQDALGITGATSTEFREILEAAGLTHVQGLITCLEESGYDTSTYVYWNNVLKRRAKVKIELETLGQQQFNFDTLQVTPTGDFNIQTGYFTKYQRQMDRFTAVDFVHSNSIDKIWIKLQDIIVRQAVSPPTDEANYMDIHVKRHDFHFLDERVAQGDLPLAALPLNGASILSQVEVMGYDYQEEPEKMPPLEFTYSQFKPYGKDFRPISGEQLPAVNLAHPEYELADLNGNGLPDIVHINGTVARYWRNKGDGSFDWPRQMKNAPTGMSLAEPEVALVDADGDGRVDLMVNKAGLVGYFSLNPDGEWDERSMVRYENAPSFSFLDPEVQLMDLTGDGITDVVRNGGRFEMYFHDRAEGWNDYKFVNKAQLEDFPNVAFSDPRVRTAGLSGGGLQDIALVQNGNISYWPHQGYGTWGKRVYMKNSPRFPLHYNPARIMMGDFDGDGLTDLVYIEDDKVTLWVNQSGNAWSDPIEIKGTPRVTDMDAVRAVDVMGTGVPGILWSYEAGSGTKEQMYFLDLTGGIKPYLLNQMQNNMGALTRVEYRSSVKDYLRDLTSTPLSQLNNSTPLSSTPLTERSRSERSRSDDPTLASPWKTTLPMPVLVVGKVEVHDLISQGKLVTEYAYHHGYWDGVEREFRGFGRVDQRDTESFEQYNKKSLFVGDGEGWFDGTTSTPLSGQKTSTPLSGPSTAGSPGLSRAGSRGLSGVEAPHEKVEKIHYSPPMFTRSWFHLGPVQETAVLEQKGFRPRSASDGTNSLLGGTQNGPLSRAETDWTEVNYAEEYHAEKWDGVTEQSITIQRPQEMVTLLKALPRRARRDALRTMRGAVMRTELYGLDGTRFQHKPYTITEAQYGVRTEFTPEESPFILPSQSSLTGKGGLSEAEAHHSGYIFFSYSVGQRSTQWERGKDPMTSFAFTAEHDAYGQALKQVAIAIPRYRNFLLSDANPPKGYAATLGTTVLINKDTDTHYLIGRPEQGKSYEIVNTGEDDVFSLRDKILAEDAGLTFNLLSHSLNYYDGGIAEAYVGLPLGQIGDYGIPVRSETLVSTDAIWTDAYGSVPDVLKDKSLLPGSYPAEFTNLLPNTSGYQYKSGGAYETGYYVEGGKVLYDFQVSGATVYGNTVSMRDALDREATVSFDSYTLLPKTVTDPVGMQTEAWYDYRLFTPYKAKDPNDNFSEFAFNRLGLLYKSAVKGKYDWAHGDPTNGAREGDDLEHSASQLEYDFFNFMENGAPVWVKTSQRQYHYYGPSPEFGDQEDTLTSCQYSDGFGRLLQSRVQAEEIIYGDPLFGSSGLPADQSLNDNCIGYENTDPDRPNVVVNGWTVYNNKGKPVEQYEPFFARGYDYTDSRYANVHPDSLWHLVNEYTAENGTAALWDQDSLATYINAKTQRNIAPTPLLTLLKDLYIVLDEIELEEDYIDFGDRDEYAIGTDDFSVSFWMRMDNNIANGSTVMSNLKYDGVDTYEGGFCVKVDTVSNVLQFIMADGNATGNNGLTQVEVPLPNKNTWHHVTWVRKGNDGSNFSCYVNNNTQSTTVVYGNMDSGNIATRSNLKIGSDIGGTSGSPVHFKGYIAQVKLFDRALQDEDVAILSSDPGNCQPVYPEDLLLYAPMDESEGTLIRDKALGKYGQLQLNSHTWQRRRNTNLTQVCYDEESTHQVMGPGFIGQKASMYYDTRGQVVRSIYLDNTESRVVMGTPHDLEKPPVIAGEILNLVQDGTRDNYTPSPWVSYAFDANDLGKQYSLPDGESYESLGLIAPTDSSQGYESHFATPKSSEIDELGRTIRTTEHMGTGDAADDLVMQYEYDIRGNVTRIIDALGRDVFTHKYDLANQTLWTEHLDSGVKTVVYDLMGRPTEMRDAKGSHIINSYDTLNRPIRMWAADNSSQSLSLRSIAIFGDDSTYGPTDPKSSNHLGMPYRSYDEAGMVEICAYDFKGGALSKKQQVISDATLLSNFPAGPSYTVTPYTIDWVGLGSLPTVLDSRVYQTDVDHHDALGRPGTTTLPADVNSARKELKAEYNTAGGLKKVHYDGTEYIKEMAFNAKGQPLLTVMGNKVMTRYSYSPTSFKLLRTQSEEYTYKKILNEHQYSYKTGTKKHNTAHQTDLAGNILKILERSTNCGLSGTPDQLDRKFKYDPINRLLEATGRENQGASDTDLWDNTSPTGNGGNPSPSALQAYTRKYSYDKMGNILQLKQTAGNTFTRNFHYDTIGTNNLLHSIKKADDITNYSSFTFDVNGNKLTSGISRNYVWDYADQLKAYLNQTGTGNPSIYAQYLYSGGQRVKKLVRDGSSGNTETTVYIDGIFEHRYNSNANVQSIVHVGGIATVRTGHSFDGMPSTTFQLNNHLGSVNFRLDVTGKVLDREEYYPFGDSSVRTWADNQKRYRYVGKEKDAESQLYYYGARYYSAWTCRFISVDPLIGQTFYLSSFTYADNNPVMMNDPTGMSSSPTDPPKGADPSLYDETPPDNKTNEPSNTPEERPKGVDPSLFEQNSTIQSNNGGKIIGHPIFDSNNKESGGVLLKSSDPKLIKSFIKMINKRTGNEYNIDKNGLLYNLNNETNTTTDKHKSAEFSSLVERAINGSEIIEFNLVPSNSIIYFDSYDSGDVDMRDLSQMPAILQAGMLAHIFSERLESPGGYSNRTRDTTYDIAHAIGLEYESKVVSEMLGQEYALVQDEVSLPKEIRGPEGNIVGYFFWETWTFGATKFRFKRGLYYLKNKDGRTGVKPNGDILSKFKKS